MALNARLLCGSSRKRGCDDHRRPYVCELAPWPERFQWVGNVLGQESYSTHAIISSKREPMRLEYGRYGAARAATGRPGPGMDRGVCGAPYTPNGEG